MIKIFSLAALAAMLAPMAAAAQGGSPNEAFLQMVSDTNRTEIGVAQYVEKHTTNPTAISYARRMIADHTTNENQVRSLANQVGAALTATTPVQLTQEIQKLSRLSGRA